MSAVPDEAIEAASAAYMATPRCRCIQTPQDKKQMRAALEAAMPAIREQIAAEISNYWDACGELIDSHNGARLAFDAIIIQIREGGA